MRFSISRPVFLSYLANVMHAIPSVSPTPELSGVYIQAAPDHMILRGSDSKQTIEALIPVDETTKLNIEETGSMVFNAAVLNELLRRMDGEMITADSLDDAQIRFYGTSGSKFDLIGRAGSTYPPLNLSQPKTHITLPSHILHDLARELSFACAVDSPRVYLNGINIRIADHKLIATATNTFALSRKVIPVTTDETIQVTVPVKAVTTISSMLGSSPTVDLYLDRQKLQFVCDSMLFQTSLLEGNFPDTDQLLRHPTSTDITVNTSEFEGTILRSTVYTADKAVDGGIVPVLMKYEPGEISIEVNTNSIGSCRQFIEDCEVEGASGKVAFNANMMLQLIRAARGHDRVVLHLGNETTPMRVTLPDDPSLQMLLVPIRYL
ncbi:DNA polymerase III subunit beta [Allobaculum mucilyticum]|uniref:DNA polymerase III subunit beta n=1 Tax=Allobaculum mucilyticum TaxID=2834459 RepID=UPI001E3D304A|nr:DNA polymerase III subunit beta [Allobaculum mucilyticum]UNT97339.1 DNA polymerase III subunit beta [Allobaculum mucilyticum]